MDYTYNPSHSFPLQTPLLLILKLPEVPRSVALKHKSLLKMYVQLGCKKKKKRKSYLTFVTAWLDLESIMLCEISYLHAFKLFFIFAALIE